jgi:predicted phosphodiesterase
MNRKQLYDYCKRKRGENYEWSSILRFLVKDGKLARTTTVNELKEIYKDVAAHLAVEGKFNEDGSKYDEVYESFCKFIGKVANSFPVAPIADNKGKDVILTLSDIHVPNYDKGKLINTVEQWRGKANILVINGDFMNGDRLSTHAKFKHESFKEEIAEARILLEYLASAFQKVYLLDDNHVDDRWKRFLGNDVAPDLHFLTVHPYDYLTKGLDNVIRAKDTFDNEFKDEIGHFLILGDCMFSHAFVSGKDGKSARTVKDWYDKWRPVFNLPNIRMVIHGHVHQLSINYEYDFAVVQAGTFANLEGLRYSMGGHTKSSPPCYGYTVIVQENGRTDFSQTRIIKL